jgi:hypothetical protein
LEVVKGYGSKFLGSRRILFVKVSNLAFSMSEICCRFSRVRAFLVAFPFNPVLELSTEDTGISDLVDFVLLFTFHRDRVRQWRPVKTVVPIESEMVDVENWMELQIVWKFLLRRRGLTLQKGATGEVDDEV